MCLTCMSPKCIGNGKLWQRKARGAGALSYRDQEPGTELAVRMPELERFSEHKQ